METRTRVHWRRVGRPIRGDSETVCGRREWVVTHFDKLVIPAYVGRPADIYGDTLPASAIPFRNLRQLQEFFSRRYHGRNVRLYLLGGGRVIGIREIEENLINFEVSVDVRQESRETAPLR